MNSKLVRRDDWFDALTRFLAENRERPFRWGSFDCCLFAANVVREMTGTDPAAAYRGQYHTMLGAARVLKGSVLTMVESMAKQYGTFRFPSPREARPGDVVLGSLDRGDTLGVVTPAHLAVFATTAGLGDYPYSVVIHAWKVG